MINKLYHEISDSLKLVRDCTIYREDVPEDFRIPCFMVTLYDQNPSRGINGRMKNSVRMDVLYFPEDETNYQEECWGVGQDLQRGFCLNSFKIKNRNLKITDRVLHVMFDVDYREYLDTSEVKMQEMSQTTGIKEE